MAPWTLRQPFSDHYASIVVDGVNCQLSQLFANGEGPRDATLMNEKGKVLLAAGVAAKSRLRNDMASEHQALNAGLIEGFLTAKTLLDKNEGACREALTEEAKAKR